MRELKIFLVVVFFTALVYWGVEPYAHSIMKPHVAPANFNLEQEDIDYANSVIQLRQSELQTAQGELEKAKLSGKAEEISSAETKVSGAQKALENAQTSLTKSQALWEKVNAIDFTRGDKERGAEAFTTAACVTCHGIKAANLEAPIQDSALGVLPPDLSDAALLYDDKFLAALIMDPALALKVDHKFPDGFLMTAYNAEMTGEPENVVNQTIADLVAYLKDVSQTYEKNFDETTRKELNDKYAKAEGISEAEKSALIEQEFTLAKQKDTFINACGRCHDMKYDGFTSFSKKDDLKGYLGSLPPDMSMMIRSRGHEYLNNFINNTQKLLPGTAMPRVGLNEQAQANVIAYIEKIGDSKKEERENTGIYVMIFFVILSIFAIGWKRSVWKKLH